MNADPDLARAVANWAAPPELAGSPPRPVRMTGTGVLLMVVALGMLLGGVILGLKLRNDSNARSATVALLAEHGEETNGTVLRLWRTTGKNKSYRVRYQFGAQGQVYHSESEAPRGQWERLNEGAAIRVRYLPANPSINQPADWEPKQIAPWLVVAVPAFLAIIAFFNVIMLRKQRRLLEDGRAAPGVINKVTRTKNGKRVRYDFLLPGGLKEKGSGLLTRGTAEIGAVLTVVYDPDEPSRNAPYPFNLVRPAQ
jgi:uncharacterized protein DUF3592